MLHSKNSRANTPAGLLYNTPGRKSTPRLTKSARARKKAETLRQQAAEAAKEQAAARRRKSIYDHLTHGGEFMITSGKNPFATTTGRISRKNAGDLYSFDERFRYKAATQPHNMQLCWLNLNGKSTGILLIQSKFEKESMTLQFSLFNRLYSVELQYSDILTVGKGKDIIIEDDGGGELVVYQTVTTIFNCKILYISIKRNEKWKKRRPLENHREKPPFFPPFKGAETEQQKNEILLQC